MPKAFQGKTGRGFSLIELMVVVAIILAVSAIAMPRFLTSISTYRLRNSMSQVAGMLQQQRMLAVRSNTAIGANSITVNNQQLAFVDVNGNGAADGSEPQILLPRGITIDGSGHPGDATSGVANYVSTQPLFNERGLPCVVQASGLCQNPDMTSGTAKQVGYVFYFKNSGVFGVSNWGAITITPSGRIRTWMWNGTTYSQL